MKRRRTIAKTSKQTIQPSLAEEEKRRGGIRRKREMKEEENERKRREGEKEINARKIGAGGRRGRSGREKHARREGLYAYYQILPDARGVWRVPRRIIGIGTVTVAENGVI